MPSLGVGCWASTWFGLNPEKPEKQETVSKTNAVIFATELRIRRFLETTRRIPPSTTTPPAVAIARGGSDRAVTSVATDSEGRPCFEYQ